MIDCAFLPVFYERHKLLKQGLAAPASADYSKTEAVWMDMYGLGRFETYQFIYADCTDIAHLQEWMVLTKGEQQIKAAAAAFREWQQQNEMAGDPAVVERKLLSDEQLLHWQQQGYIRVSGLVEEELCDAVTDFICGFLAVDLGDPSTWYKGHTDWHGLMLQQYQHESMHLVRTHPNIKQLFAELYNTYAIIPQTDKGSFNPPETDDWKFVHHLLHWDMNYRKPDPTYIQGLIYLNDVPENRGPLKVVPGFHKQFDDWQQKYPDEIESYHQMRTTLKPEYIAGKKGDVVLWLQTLPHAASCNHSDLPRFVQYLSFNRL
jgi:hypothetical protein